MARIITDEECVALLAERKTLPKNWRNRLQPLPKERAGFSQRDYELEGGRGNRFVVFTRINDNYPNDFSIGLQFIDVDEKIRQTLIRFNGSSHKHTNHWEKIRGMTPHSFHGAFHIHRATERYQRDGQNIDGYAEVTTKFSSFETALQVFVSNFGFEFENNDPQMRLFES